MPTLFENLSSKLLDLGLRNKSINFKDNKLRSSQIVVDYETLLASLIKVVSNGSTSFSGCQGLNSNFSVVPDSALLNKLEEIDTEAH